MEIYRTEIRISKEFIFLDKLFFFDNCATYNRNTFLSPMIWWKFRFTFHDLDIRRNIRLEISQTI